MVATPPSPVVTVELMPPTLTMISLPTRGSPFTSLSVTVKSFATLTSVVKSSALIIVALRITNSLVKVAPL